MGSKAGAGLLSLAVLVVAASALVILGAAPAQALPEWIHDGATTCEVCHHPQPPSFQKCAPCHPDASLPNAKCTQCHAGKLTNGNRSCWSCHAPGVPQPSSTDPNCQACHGPMPHLGAQLFPDPGCTTCHGTNPTPHHDGKEHLLPDACTDCHQQEPHDGNPCSACHRTDIHPHRPEVPAACNLCHTAATFSTGDCRACHAGTQPFAGQTDNDIHDATLPDAPISAKSCRSCHPQMQKHAGTVACLECHFQATPFHHGMAADPGYKTCTDCHADKPQHGNGLPCRDCHPEAHHQVDPPTPPAAVCNLCHQPHTFGTRDCYRCHTLPIYHQLHGPGSCGSCHPGRQNHAGRFGCLDCHPNAARGHHIGQVSIPGCRGSNCHSQQPHLGRVSCGRCHPDAAHRARPLSAMPANRWATCTPCHRFASGVKQPCSECHDAAHHRTDYRAPACQTCHTGKAKHAGTVDCCSCHVNIAPGHHDRGTVDHRGCGDCHKGVEAHASGTAGGIRHDCATCHSGNVHGPMGMPGPDRCLDCHQQADAHAQGTGCTLCHWPAVHRATPVAAAFGPPAPVVSLNPPCEDFSPAERETFDDTGLDVRGLVGLALLLLGLGALLRSAGGHQKST